MKEGNWMLSLGLFLLRLALLILVVVGIFKVGEYAYTYCYSVVSDTAAEETGTGCQRICDQRYVRRKSGKTSRAEGTGKKRRRLQNPDESNRI